MEFTIEELQFGEVWLYNIKGEMDVINAKKLKEYMVQKIYEGITRMVISLEDVEHINSYGLGVLRSVLIEAEARKGKVVLSDINPRILNIFQMVGLDEVFMILDTKEEALEEMGALKFLKEEK